ncbi:MAG: Ku protein [Veillonellales bacterium]
MRPIWNGAISFGLVNVPIKLYSTTKKKTVRFNQLRKSDGCRIQQKKICGKDGSEVSQEEIVKGYEVSPERYVVVSEKELEALNPIKSRNIDIQDFVDLNQIDPIFYVQSYYLVPDKGAVKAYSLLLTAMKQSNKVAIARFVLRNKEYLCAIRPIGNVLSLATMFFADEVIPQTELEGLPESVIEPTERELKVALQLVESLSAKFEPEKYKDEYRERVLNLIQEKAEGQTVVVEKVPEEQKGKVVDLMAALEASLSQIKKKNTKKAPSERARKKHA